MPKPDARLVETVANAIWDKKGFEVVAYDVSGVLDYTDAIVVCSAGSDRHAAAVAENVVDEMRVKRGLKPIGEEGLRGGRWALLDFSDVVVHVFHRPVRDYYELDRLYADCPRVALTEPEWVRDFEPSDFASADDYEFDDGAWQGGGDDHIWDGSDDDEGDDGDDGDGGDGDDGGVFGLSHDDSDDHADFADFEPAIAQQPPRAAAGHAGRELGDS
jgi:ribosome-associated protein